MSKDWDRILGIARLSVENDLRKQSDIARNFLDSSDQQAARSLSTIVARINPGLSPIRESVIADALKIALPDHLISIWDGSAALKVARQFGVFNESYLSLIDSPAQRLFNDLSRIDINLLSTSASLAAQAISNATSYEWFTDTFAANLLERLAEISELEDIDTIEEEAAVIEELFSNQVKTLPRSFLTREGMIQILIALILWWTQIVEGRKTEQRNIETIRQTEIRILDKINTLKPEESKEVFYTVLHRPVKLRNRPLPQKPIIETLYPNQRVVLIEAQGKWLHVKYFDYIDGAPKSGWVLKKYLKRSDS